MRKWRTYYPLIKIKENEAGITLVELLAAISILSIVILLAGSVHMFGQRQFIDQSKSASQANDLSYAMTVITTDVRKLRPDETIEVNPGKIEVQDKFIYELVGSELKKGNTVLVDEVEVTFKSTKNNDGVHIELKNIQGKGSSKTYETTIYFRRLPNDQE